jgi:pyruvate,orthophosphate dikinase
MTPIAASVQMYSSVVMSLPKEDLEHRLRAMKERIGVKEDTAVPASGWKDLVAEYKAFFREKTAKDFPEDPMEQLWGAIGAVFGSWMAEKAVTYRRVEKITGLLGTAVNVVQNGLWQYRRYLWDRRLFHTRPQFWRARVLWRLPG